ncbi:hypothetical protein T03_10254 [Trichinella britovi]|uniref:Uncharacterized protein n=1 Tax=Trichinella britovi TaxID=45882 RepID=A0A0V1AK48_TRIBR|nr:hypothetical protein T03_10254 [Trichinella britovi]
MRVDCMIGSKHSEYTFVLFGHEQSEESTPSTATNSESIYNRTKQQYEKSMVIQNGSEAQPPMSGSIKADNLAIFVGDPNHH